MSVRRDREKFWIAYCTQCQWEAMFNARLKRHAEDDFEEHVSSPRHRLSVLR